MYQPLKTQGKEDNECQGVLNVTIFLVDSKASFFKDRSDNNQVSCSGRTVAHNVAHNSPLVRI